MSDVVTDSWSHYGCFVRQLTCGHYGCFVRQLTCGHYGCFVRQLTWSIHVMTTSHFREYYFGCGQYGEMTLTNIQVDVEH
ncbi:hypothetical protein BgiBS90_000483 [Biomphalaria glabrata]|nr:hypothetical protein BgiBS90_000483 [Biomphalaria glabrata]